MKKSSVQTEKRPRKALTTVLIIIFSTLAVIASIFCILSIMYYTEAAVDVCWKSGEIIICDESITIPCKVEDFERQLDTKIGENENSDVIKPVNMNKKGHIISFSVYVHGDWITGIIVELRDLSSPDDVILPGNVTLDDDIDDITKEYRTGLLNIYHSHWSEDIINSDCISSGYRYIDFKSYCVEIHTTDDFVDAISYYYNPDEFYDKETGTQITIKDEYTN